MLPKLDCDILALQETYARAEGVKLPGYVGYSGPTNCAQASYIATVCGDPTHPPGSPRTAIYVKQSIPHVVVCVSDLVTTIVECCAIIVRLRNTDTAVASV